MTWTTIWIISGIVSAVWHIVDEWWQHAIFESSKSSITAESIIIAIFCLIAGPIGIAIKIWEKWLDPNNI